MYMYIHTVQYILRYIQRHIDYRVKGACNTATL